MSRTTLDTPGRGRPSGKRLLRLALVLSLGNANETAQAQERGIAGGERLGVLTDLHGWVSGMFQDIRNDTVVLARENSTGSFEVPYESVVAWRVPDRRHIGRAVRHSLLGGILGSMVGVGVGFEGATKVTAPSEVRRESLRFGITGAVVSLALMAKPAWREVSVVLATAAPGEQMLVMRERSRGSSDYSVVASTGPASSERGRITRSEIDAIDGTTALDAIRRLRPQFLRARRAEVGRQALVLPLVYLDGARLGALNTLESIQLRTVLEIEFYSPTDATMRWGVGHDGGVIHVMLRRA